MSSKPETTPASDIASSAAGQTPEATQSTTRKPEKLEQAVIGKAKLESIWAKREFTSQEKQLISKYRGDALLRGAITGAIVQTAFYFGMRKTLPRASIRFISANLFGLFGGIAAATTVVPNFIRESMLFLPNDSSIKIGVMSLYVIGCGFGTAWLAFLCSVAILVSYLISHSETTASSRSPDLDSKPRILTSLPTKSTHSSIEGSSERDIQSLTTCSRTIRLPLLLHTRFNYFQPCTLEQYTHVTIYKALLCKKCCTV